MCSIDMECGIILLHILLIVVLQHYCKLKEQMEGKQFYSALKTLEQLEHTYLPPVKGLATESYNVHTVSATLCMLPPLCLRYTFSDLLSREILKLRESIQDQSSDELTVNLMSVKPQLFHSYFFTGFSCRCAGKVYIYWRGCHAPGVRCPA